MARDHFYRQVMASRGLPDWRGANASPAQWAVLLFAVAWGIRLAYFLLLRRYDVFLRSEVEQVAASLAAGTGFANPYAVPTGPTAHVAPLYPFLLSLVYRLFGTGQSAEVAEQLLTVTCASLGYALLPVVARSCGLPVMAAVAGGALGALAPVHFLVETQGKESALSGLVLIGLLLLTRQRGLAGVWVGLAWGVALLLSPAFFPVMLAWMAIEIARTPKWRCKTVRSAGAALAVASLTLMPWTLRNHLELGGWIFVRDNFGLELFLSHHDGAPLDFLDRAALVSLGQRHPWRSPEESARVARLGEVAYQREKLHAAFAWVRANPREACERLVRRIVRFWFLPWGRMSFRIFSWAVTAAALTAWFIWWIRTRHAASWLIGGLWVAFPLVYYLLLIDNRYRYPIEWSLYLMAGHGVYLVFARWRRCCSLCWRPRERGCDARR